MEGSPPAPLTLDDVVVNTTTAVTSSVNPSILNCAAHIHGLGDRGSRRRRDTGGGGAVPSGRR